jgi:hypothetical protein
MRGPQEYPDELERCNGQKREAKKVAVFARIVIAENVQRFLQEVIGTDQCNGSRRREQQSKPQGRDKYRRDGMSQRQSSLAAKESP